MAKSSSKKKKRSSSRKKIKRNSRNEPIIPVAHDHFDLTMEGWSIHDSAKERHEVIYRAIKKFGYAPIIERLNAIAIRLHNREPNEADKIRRDMVWAHKEFRGHV